MKKYEQGYYTVGSFISFLKSNPSCKGNVHIKKVVKELNDIANKDLPLFFNLAYIADDFGYTDNIEIIQTPDEVHIKTKKRKITMVTQQNNTTKVNLPLTTEVQKIDWLNNRIKDLEYLLESDSNVDADDVECNLQMLRELLSIKMSTCRENAVRKIKDNLQRDLADFLKVFGTDLTDAEKVSIKSITGLQLRGYI